MLEAARCALAPAAVPCPTCRPQLCVARPFSDRADGCVCSLPSARVTAEKLEQEAAATEAVDPEDEAEEGEESAAEADGTPSAADAGEPEGSDDDEALDAIVAHIAGGAPPEALQSYSATLTGVQLLALPAFAARLLRYSSLHLRSPRGSSKAFHVRD